MVNFLLKIFLPFAVGLTVRTFDSAIPYLPLIWLVILAIYTWEAITNKYVLGRLSQIKDRLSSGARVGSYIIVFIVGGLLFSFYWWGLNSFFSPQIAAYQANQSSHPQVSAPKLPPTTAELEQHLREQIQFIQMSCKYFDEGEESEAKRIASSFHILFISTQDNPSLLEQLRIRDDLMFPDTASPYDNDNLMSYAGLVGMKMSTSNNTKWLAKCQMPPLPVSRPIPYISFDKWWHGIIIDNKDKAVFTRESLVLAISEQDGGISVASKLDPAYIDLARKNAMGWKKGKNGKPILGVELASIRQISWEVLEGIHKRYPQYSAN